MPLNQKKLRASSESEALAWHFSGPSNHHDLSISLTLSAFPVNPWLYLSWKVSAAPHM